MSVFNRSRAKEEDRNSSPSHSDHEKAAIHDEDGLPPDPDAGLSDAERAQNVCLPPSTPGVLLPVAN